MAHAETYRLLLETVTAEMRQMTPAAAQQLAFEITSIVNASLGRASSSSAHLEIAERLVPCGVRNIGTLTLGWHAYRIAHEPSSISPEEHSSTKVVCTLPVSIRTVPSVRSGLMERGIWAGSLMTSISGLINNAQQELVVVTPYWSTQGVVSLLRHVTRATMSGVSVTVLTQPRHRMKNEEAEALRIFVDSLGNLHAKVTARCPQADGVYTPLLHAKAVIRDGIEAYIGSANFTASGVEQSFELGVHVGGSTAAAVTHWAKAIEQHCEIWN